jgi:stage III sporulation protein AG
VDVSSLVKHIKDALGSKSTGKSLSPKEKWMLFLLSGLLLTVIVFPIGKKEENKVGGLSETSSRMDGKNYTKSTGVSNGDEKWIWNEDIAVLKQYEASLSEELEAILSEMDGVGMVEAWVTLAAGSEKILYQENQSEASELHEEDHAGGTRKESKEKIQQEVLLGNDGNPYVVKMLQPEVAGVLVVAEGAGDSSLKKNITEAVQVLFGIEAHRIKVAKKKVEE